MTRRWWTIAVVVAACSRGERAPRPDDRMNVTSLGALKFPVTGGTPAARAHFNRGLLALHSFWYDEAKRAFQAAIDADKSLNMAYWGLAMSHCQLLWGDDDTVAAKAALAAMPDPEQLSDREQAWVMATIELLKPGDVRASRKRFANAMNSIYEYYRDDESAAFLAAALLSSTRPEDLNNLAIRSRAAELASSVFAKNPNHPGAAHYLIHAYDTPELAKEALPHARAYASIAPAAFHARHMPAHIFTRLGMWGDGIASCRAAWDASVAAAAREKLSANHHDFHSLSWLVEMPFEVGRRSEADAALKTFADAVRAGLNRQHRAGYASEVASYMMRTGEWTRVDELLAPLDAPAVEDATTGAPNCGASMAAPPALLLERVAILDTRARAAAARHDLPATERHAKDLDDARAELRAFLQTTQPPELVARFDAANARAKRALLARAASDDVALLEVLRESVGDANVEVGGESNPSAFSVQEELANTLLRLDRPTEAAAEYVRVLAKQPRRANALLGAARAYLKSGDVGAANRYYAELVELWNAAEPATPGLAEARSAARKP